MMPHLSHRATVMRHSGDTLAQSFCSLQRWGAPAMSGKLRSSREAAQQFGISVTSLYDWLARSDIGEFMLRGQPFTICYLQGGARGQGRIQIEASEIQRIKDAMRVHPQPRPKRRQAIQPRNYPGITVPLGRPED